MYPAGGSQSKLTLKRKAPPGDESPAKRKCESGSSDVESLSGADKFEFFYGSKSPFSQHYPVEFTIDKVRFNCAEQYMMYMKAVTFKDKEFEKKILASKDPKEQKRFGRKVRKFDADIWRRKSIKIVEKANEAKFSQNSELKRQLLATNPRVLVETSPRDRLWGIGMGRHNPKALDMKTWRGKNLLGFSLTRVRNKLMKERENVDQKKQTTQERSVTGAEKATPGKLKPSPEKGGNLEKINKPEKEFRKKEEIFDGGIDRMRKNASPEKKKEEKKLEKGGILEKIKKPGKEFRRKEEIFDGGIERIQMSPEKKKDEIKINRGDDKKKT